jgi:hypothetical protein
MDPFVSNEIKLERVIQLSDAIAFQSAFCDRVRYRLSSRAACAGLENRSAAWPVSNGNHRRKRAVASIREPRQRDRGDESAT